MKSVHVVISGRVTGVGFRAGVKNEADKLGLVGWVRNRKSRPIFLGKGKVEAVFSGKSGAVDAIVAWCRKGPLFAAVDRIEVKKVNLRDGLKGFTLLKN